MGPRSEYIAFERELTMEIILLVLKMLICVWFGWKLRLFWQKLKFKRSRKRGSKAETEAIKLLDKSGYKVLSR